MNKMLKMVQYLLEADAQNSEFIEIKSDNKNGQAAWMMNVKVIGPKEWDYFGTNVKVDKDGHIVKNGDRVGTVSKTPHGFRAEPPKDYTPFGEGANRDLTRETLPEAVFTYLKFYFAEM